MNKMLMSLDRQMVETLLQSLKFHKDSISKIRNPREYQNLVNLISLIELKKSKIKEKDYYEYKPYKYWRVRV
jgi:hypothetical protein